MLTTASYGDGQTQAQHSDNRGFAVLDASRCRCHAVYSATKGFDLLFGEGLWGELRGTGVDALVIGPGPTATE